MKMMKNIRTFLIAVTAIVCIALLTGCAGGKNGAAPVNLALIGGGHSNMPVFSANCKAIHGNMYDAAYTHGMVTMVNCDGSPEVFFQAAIPEDEVSGLSKNRKKMIADNYTVQLQNAYLEAKAKTPEVNTLKAITMASRSLGASGCDNVLVIVDSGLQTTGYLNFTKGLLNAEPKAVVDALVCMQALPDLTGVSCVWIGLGDTIAPQEQLSERQRANLKAIWENVLFAAGAASVTFDGGYSTNTAYESAPAVTPVEVEAEEITVPTSTDVKSDPIDTIILDSTRLKFRPDEAVFVSETEAESILSGVSAELKSHPDNKVFVIGTTAGSGGDTRHTLELSDARAEVVKERLIKLGVPEGQMTAMGLGSTDPYHEWDEDENGRMIEEIAKKNRKTIIMDVNSPEASMLPQNKAIS